MKEVISEKVIGNHIIRTFYDESPENPRKWDNVTTMVCLNKGYSLGDKHDYDSSDYNSWDEMEQRIKEDYKRYMIKPLYLYDHGGITISTSPFSCNWDSGQIGFVLIEEKKWKMCMGETEVTEERLNEIINNEVKEYDQYLRGDVYGVKVFEKCTCDKGHIHENEIHACWGFYSEEDAIEDGMCYVK